jgi:hypothetical protein
MLGQLNTSTKASPWNGIATMAWWHAWVIEDTWLSQDEITMTKFRPKCPRCHRSFITGTQKTWKALVEYVEDPVISATDRTMLSVSIKNPCIFMRLYALS